MEQGTLQYSIVICGLAALLFAWRRSVWIRKQDAGDETMRRIAGHIRDGAMAFLGREYRVLAIFVAVVAALLACNLPSHLVTCPSRSSACPCHNFEVLKIRPNLPDHI